MNKRPIFLTGLSLVALISFAVLIASGQGRTAQDFVLGEKPSQLPADDIVEQSDVVQSAETLNTMPSCRYGVADLSGTSPDWMRAMGIGWYLNFNTNRSSYTDIQYTPIVRVRQNRDDDGNPLLPRGYTFSPNLTSLINDAVQVPGKLYLVGNEVDRIGQDGTAPDLYAQGYHEFYHAIKAVDPTARFAISGLVQVTPNRLRYLDLVWDSYIDQFGVQMPIDVWNAHVYVLPEIERNGSPNDIASTAVGTDNFGAIMGSGGNVVHCGDPSDDTYCYAEHDDIDIFAQQITSMREWMKEHGQQNKPLVISEYSQLYPYELEGDGCFLQDEYGQCFDPARVTSFMEASHTFLESTVDPDIGFPADGNKLVQQWLWFASYTEKIGHASNLFVQQTLDGEPGNDAMLTDMGRAFKSAATSGDLRPNLVPYQITSRKNASGDVVLSVSVRNNGDSHVVEPFDVTFYSNAALTQPIGSERVEPTIIGCAQQIYTFSVTWPTAGGAQDIWVKVDSGNVLNEVNENDNVLQERVVVGSEIYLPAVRIANP